MFISNVLSLQNKPLTYWIHFKYRIIGVHRIFKEGGGGGGAYTAIENLRGELYYRQQMGCIFSGKKGGFFKTPL